MREGEKKKEKANKYPDLNCQLEGSSFQIPYPQNWYQHYASTGYQEGKKPLMQLEYEGVAICPAKFFLTIRSTNIKQKN